MNELLKVLQVHGPGISSNANVKKALLRLGITESKEVMLDKEKINQVESFSYLGRVFNKDGGCNEDFQDFLIQKQILSIVYNSNNITLNHKIFSKLMKIFQANYKDAYRRD